MAFAVSAVVLWTLEGTSIRVMGPDHQTVPFLLQALLWSGLSLFLGLFLGLIMQGGGMLRRD